MPSFLPATQICASQTPPYPGMSRFAFLCLPKQYILSDRLLHRSFLHRYPFCMSVCLVYSHSIGNPKRNTEPIPQNRTLNSPPAANSLPPAAELRQFVSHSDNSCIQFITDLPQKQSAFCIAVLRFACYNRIILWKGGTPWTDSFSISM